MAESIAALSLACNVIQVIDTALHACRTCAEIYGNGTSKQNLALEEYSRQLQNAHVILQKDIDVSPKPLNKDEAELLQIAIRCVKASDDLQLELKGLKTQGRRAIVKNFFRSTWRKQHVQDLEKELRQHNDALQIHLLVRLNIQSKAQAVCQGEQFVGLNDQLQHFIMNVSHGHVTLSKVVEEQAREIARHIDNESRRTRQDPDDTFSMSQALQQKASNKERLLHSLYFSEMNQRRSKVEPCYPGTYQWVFRDPVKQTRIKDSLAPTQNLWSNFPQWLASAHQVYWISGKPGSGKSTLMKFILLDPRLEKGLSRSDFDGRTVILSHFMWLAGSELQKTLHGLVASLVYQILDFGCVDHNLLIQPRSTLHRKHCLHDWDTDELKNALKTLLEARQGFTLIAIDGYDEFVKSEGTDRLSQFLDNLKSIPRVKIIIASREEPWLEEYFKMQPRLRLQHLNREDIKLFATGKVTEMIQRFPGRLHLAEAETLIRIVTEKASGVFLWVDLVLQSLGRGMTHNNDFDTLCSRLNDLPDELNALYDRMWERNKADHALYAQDAAEIFAYNLVSPVKVGELGFLVNNRLRYLFWNGKGVLEKTHFDHACEELVCKVKSRCAGFLEIVDYPDVQRNFSNISFIHRTALDFIRTRGRVMGLGGQCHLSIPERISHLSIARFMSVEVTHLQNHSEGTGTSSDSRPQSIGLEFIVKAFNAAGSDTEVHFLSNVIEFFLFMVFDSVDNSEHKSMVSSGSVTSVYLLLPLMAFFRSHGFANSLFLSIGDRISDSFWILALTVTIDIGNFFNEFFTILERWMEMQDLIRLDISVTDLLIHDSFIATSVIDHKSARFALEYCMESKRNMLWKLLSFQSAVDLPKTLANLMSAVSTDTFSAGSDMKRSTILIAMLDENGFHWLPYLYPPGRPAFLLHMKTTIQDALSFLPTEVSQKLTGVTTKPQPTDRRLLDVVWVSEGNELNANINEVDMIRIEPVIDGLSALLYQEHLRRSYIAYSPPNPTDFVDDEIDQEWFDEETCSFDGESDKQESQLVSIDGRNPRVEDPFNQIVGLTSDEVLAMIKHGFPKCQTREERALWNILNSLERKRPRKLIEWACSVGLARRYSAELSNDVYDWYTPELQQKRKTQLEEEIRSSPFTTEKGWAKLQELCSHKWGIG